MPRRKTFTVDAEKVQGNPGATVTFTNITVGERAEYLADDKADDHTILKRHLIDWKGIVDNDDKDLPSPADEPDVLNALYMDEQRAFARLFWQGPDGESAKN